MARAAEPSRARQVATSIVQRLREAGHTAYFAGGCVRDELLSLKPTDFDVATDAPPPRVRALFKRTAEVGAAFGVVLVYEEGEGGCGGAGGVTVEVATFRADGPYTDSRRPDTVHFSTPEEDAKRRDFTINALFLDPLIPAGAPGRIIDFVNGQADLAAHLVRAVGDPDQRLAEDHLRALRAVRFAARLGFDIDPATRVAISRHASHLRGVSRERIGDELRRMLLHPSRAAAVALIESLALDLPVLNEPADPAPSRGETLLAALTIHPAASEGLWLGTYLAAWALSRRGSLKDGIAPDSIKDLARTWRAALCLSNEESEQITNVLSFYTTLVTRWDALPVAPRKRLAAADPFPQAMALLLAADSFKHGAISSDYKHLENDGIGINPVPLITGEDLIATGLKPGPLFKRILDEVRDAQLAGAITTKTAAMELARSLRV